jgi:hypothetical protein
VSLMGLSKAVMIAHHDDVGRGSSKDETPGGTATGTANATMTGTTQSSVTEPLMELQRLLTFRTGAIKWVVTEVSIDHT